MRQWVIELPWATPPLSLNAGYGNHYARARKVKEVRQTAGLLARKAGIPRGLERIEVQIIWYVPDRKRRDTDNVVPTLKAVCDGLTHHGRRTYPTDWPVVPDDVPQHMAKPEPRIVYRKGCRKRLVLVVTDLGGV